MNGHCLAQHGNQTGGCILRIATTGKGQGCWRDLVAPQCLQCGRRCGKNGRDCQGDGLTGFDAHAGHAQAKVVGLSARRLVRQAKVRPAAMPLIVPTAASIGPAGKAHQQPCRRRRTTPGHCRACRIVLGGSTRTSRPCTSASAPYRKKFACSGNSVSVGLEK